MAQQNQHYVPKFLLRQFLSNQQKEIVHVYDKHQNRTFKTSIRNIMAERRFNDFCFDNDCLVSFEPTVSKLEEILLPQYRKVVENRKLDGSAEQKAALSTFLAFQLLRSKGMRTMWQDIGEAVEAKVREWGHEMSSLKGWEPETEDTLKRNHLVGMHNSLQKFSQIIAQKDFLLIEAPEGHSFYLGDNPVSMHNKREFEFRGNIGLSVPGIQISMPLTQNLALCAWCPSVLDEWKRRHANRLTGCRAEIVKQLLEGRIDFQIAAEVGTEFKREHDRDELSLKAIELGCPMLASSANIEFYNSQQTAWAKRYLICANGSFALATDFLSDFPHLKDGHRISHN
jgi:hypothetical protein